MVEGVSSPVIGVQCAYVKLARKRCVLKSDELRVTWHDLLHRCDRAFFIFDPLDSTE